MKSCPICGNTKLHSDYIQFQYAGKDYILSKCYECTGIFYENVLFFDFKDDLEHNRSSKIYLEKTSDIEELVTVMYNFFTHFPDKTKGVDIGCGAGIIMDFSEKMMAKEMIGFEPSSHYSNEGKNVLGLNIIEDFFSLEKLDFQKVDFAVCFQILQLTAEPRVLLQEIKDALNGTGIALFSIPDSEGLEPKSIFLEHISLLSPGVHRTLFNVKSFEQAIIKAGFLYVRTYKKNGQLYALASDSPIPQFNIFESDRSVLLNYYINKLENLPGNTSYFKGIWYRLFRNRVDNGEYGEALELLKKADWFELWTDNEIESITGLDKLYELNSFSDAIVYYYTGILFLNYLQKNNYAEKFFLLSFLLCRKIIQVQPDMATIERDIIWLARLHYILARFYQGKIENARDELIMLISNNMKMNDNLPSPSDEIIAKAKNLLKQVN